MKPRRPAPSRETRDAMLDAQQRDTIRRMLDAGGTVTPIGPNTMIRLASGGAGTFPSRMVEEVQAQRLRSGPGDAP